MKTAASYALIILMSIPHTANAQGIVAPQASIHCHNPSLELQFTSVGATEAKSPLIQINVGRPATAGGSLFVNNPMSFDHPPNNAVCYIHVDEHYTISDVSMRIQYDKSDLGGMDRDKMERYFILLDDGNEKPFKRWFKVATGLHTDSWNAIVNVIFIVHYTKT